MCHAPGLVSCQGHIAQMTNGSGKSRRCKERSQSAWDRCFLAVLCPALLPAYLGPVPLLHAACSVAATLATVLSAALVYCAPIIVPLFVWNALGEHPTSSAHTCRHNRIWPCSRAPADT